MHQCELCAGPVSAAVVHIASGAALPGPLRPLGASAWRRRPSAPRPPAGQEQRVKAGLLGVQGAEPGATPGLWESLLSPPPSGSAARLREPVLADRRPTLSCVRAEPFGTSLLTLKKKKKVGIFLKGEG